MDAEKNITGPVGHSIDADVKANMGFDNASAVVGDSTLDGLDSEIAAIVAQMTPEERARVEKKVKLKIDCILFPMLLIFYILNYIDRGALGFAKLVGVEDDLHLKGAEFATCLSILYVGYCLFQVPSNLLLSKTKPSIYLSSCMVIWGIVSGSAAAVHNFAGLVTVRFFLGIVEAPFFPGAVYMISAWYTRKEMAMRCALLFGGNFISNACGSFIALGVTEGLDGAHGLESWRWLFIVEASITVGFALFSYFALPNYPHNTFWLKGEERAIAIWRLVKDTGKNDTSEDNQITMKEGFWLAVKDYKTWFLVANHSLITTGAGIVVFYPTVVGTLGFNRKITYALVAPPYLLAFAVTVYICHRSGAKNEKTWHMITTLFISLAGLIILASTLNTGARYFSLFLVTCFIYVAYNCNLAWISDCMPQPAPKRAAAIGLVNMIGQSGNIIAGYIYPNNQAPRYWLACVVEGAAIVLAILVTFTFKQMLKRENKKLDARESIEQPEVARSPEEPAPFRYVY